MKHLSFLSLLPLVLAASACAAAPAGSVVVMRSLGSTQCNGGGQVPAALARQLTDAVISVTATRCGSDGRMRPAMCGAADGRVGLFEIAAGSVEAAAKLGFRAIGPDVQERPCP
ncbi:MAG: hypothetical protein WAQ05_11995 [Rubrivivax sp.]